MFYDRPPARRQPFLKLEWMTVRKFTLEITLFKWDYIKIVIGWVTKNLLSRARASEGTLSRWSWLHFAVVSTHQPALGPRGGLWPVLLMCNQ
jgi:hypothetical protein